MKRLQESMKRAIGELYKTFWDEFNKILCNMTTGVRFYFITWRNIQTEKRLPIFRRGHFKSFIQEDGL